MEDARCCRPTGAAPVRIDYKQPSDPSRYITVREGALVWFAGGEAPIVAAILEAPGEVEMDAPTVGTRNVASSFPL